MRIQLKTNRLRICTLDASAAEQFSRYRERNFEFFKPYSPTYPEDLLSLDFARTFLESAQNGGKDLLRFFVFSESDPKNTCILGDITYSNIQRGVAQSCTLGYKIDQKIQGQGLMTEALACTNAYIFSVQGLHRIEANILPDNLSSIRVVQKLGFREEGIAHKLLKINGLWQDYLRFSLINE